MLSHNRQAGGINRLKSPIQIDLFEFDNAIVPLDTDFTHRLQQRCGRALFASRLTRTGLVLMDY